MSEVKNIAPKLGRLGGGFWRICGGTEEQKDRRGTEEQKDRRTEGVDGGCIVLKLVDSEKVNKYG